MSVVDPQDQRAGILEEVSFQDAGLTTSITRASASVAQLDQIADDITRLQIDGVAHANLIYMTEPDQENNRIIITVSELNSDLMKALASRYGTQLIAVRVRPGGPATAASRASDSPPFWGGARITTSTGKACTTGFAWTFPSNQPAMLTAAHCISTGGWVSYPNYTNAGAVQMSSLENWSDTGGTEYYTGQTVYRGDVALIQYSGFGSAATIYTGAQNANTSTAVAAMNSRWAQNGDAICVNGYTTGEWCGSVNNTGINVWYVFDGLTVVAKHMVQAFSLGNTCPTLGDSGGPVYQKRSDGKVTAFGIFSGSAPLVASCYVYFTDIRDPYYGLPGTLKVTG